MTKTDNTQLIHISDFDSNETFEAYLELLGLERTEENDYQYIEVKLINAVTQD